MLIQLYTHFIRRWDQGARRPIVWSAPRRVRWPRQTKIWWSPWGCLRWKIRAWIRYRRWCFSRSEGTDWFPYYFDVRIISVFVLKFGILYKLNMIKFIFSGEKLNTQYVNFIKIWEKQICERIRTVVERWDLRVIGSHGLHDDGHGPHFVQSDVRSSNARGGRAGESVRVVVWQNVFSGSEVQRVVSRHETWLRESLQRCTRKFPRNFSEKYEEIFGIFFQFFERKSLYNLDKLRARKTEKIQRKFEENT